jgi:TPR repeat protein
MVVILHLMHVQASPVVDKTMANREELAIIRGARAGRADSQLTLGRLYLFGSAGLPRSLPSALHWLDRAARQGCPKPGN